MDSVIEITMEKNAPESRAKYSSYLTLPQLPQPYPLLLDFMCRRFPKISPKVWQQRFVSGQVLDAAKQPLALDSPFVPHQKVYYFRAVATETPIPDQEHILYQDEELLVACKPHFLPVIPGGRFVQECLVYRLRATTGNDDLVPLHRLDRHTAGLVLFSKNPHSRGCYNALFSQERIEKTYIALAHYSDRYSPQGLAQCGAGVVTDSLPDQRRWVVENRISQGEPWFLRKTSSGQINARSTVKLAHVYGDYARFTLQPHTGKTHQLRLHMSGLGFPLLNDRYYPQLLAEQDDDFSRPLQLIAKQLKFSDPVTGRQHHFVSPRELLVP
jgi:tRNA pseudouridine32 synthase/23S rRNA pseudouridine746 synthase